MGIGGASLGLAVIFVAMVLLSLARTRLKGRGSGSGARGCSANGHRRNAQPLRPDRAAMNNGLPS